MSNKVKDFLAHYGTSGMKWGVVHERNEVDRAKPKFARNDPKVFRSRLAKTPMSEMRVARAQQKIDDDQLELVSTTSTIAELEALLAALPPEQRFNSSTNADLMSLRNRQDEIQAELQTLESHISDKGGS